MEIETEIQREYNPAHPNFERWQKARNLSDERAKFVESIVSELVFLSGLNVLDLGAGEGSTSQLLSKNNFVVSVEIKRERIIKIQLSDTLHPVLADCINVPLKNKSVDLIILQDVVEHINFGCDFIEKLFFLLKDNGLIFLSTPNKYSLLNLISDPHWGLPFISVLNRHKIKKYFLKYFRKADFNRSDIAELLSLNDIYTKFDKKFSILLFTNYSVEYLFGGGKGLIWSNFHLSIVRLINSLGLKRVLLKIANDKPGFINKYLTPTFYVLLKKI